MCIRDRYAIASSNHLGSGRIKGLKVVRSMEKFGEELLDDMLNVTAEIRSSNRRLSARLDEAINSSILRPSVLDKSPGFGQGSVREPEEKGEKEKKTGEDARRNKRKAEFSDDKSHKAHKMSTVEEKLDKLLNRTKSMVTKEDVNKVAEGINVRLVGVEDGQGALLERQDELEERIGKLERGRASNGDPGPRPRPQRRTVSRSREPAGAGPPGPQEEGDSKAYEAARRQIILSPVAASLEAVRTFMSKKMGMYDDMIDSLDIREIRKMFQAGGVGRKTKKRVEKVKLYFGSMYDRDLVMGHAYNLPEEHSLELVFPDYLQSLKRFMDRFAYRIRKQARDIHETRFSTAIRMDDAQQSLYLCLLYTSPSPRD